MSSFSMNANLNIYGITSLIPNTGLINPKTYTLLKTAGEIRRLYITVSDIYNEDNCQVTNATLFIPILSYLSSINSKIIVYSVDSPLNPGPICWNSLVSKPLTKIAESSMGPSTLQINLTSLINYWLNNPNSNNGLLITCNENINDQILVNTNTKVENGLSLSLNYSCMPTPCSPDFFEFIYYASGSTEYCSPAIDISKIKVVSFYIKNQTANEVTLHLESSPDDLNYVLSSKELILSGNGFDFLNPYYWSKFIRICASSNQILSLKIFIQLQN